MTTVTRFGAKQENIKKDSDLKVSKSDDSYTRRSIRGKDKNKHMSKSDHSYTKGATTTTGQVLGVGEK